MSVRNVPWWGSVSVRRAASRAGRRVDYCRIAPGAHILWPVVGLTVRYRLLHGYR